MDPGACDPDHEPLPGERAALALDGAGLLIVGGLRSWVTPLRAPGAGHPDWRELFGMAGLAGPAALAFDGMMSVLARSAQRSLDVRCCHCPSVSADEEAMLSAVIALQAGDTGDALRLLADWLPATALPEALRHLRRFATIAAAAGLRPLPDTDPSGIARPRVAPGVTLH